MFYGAAPHLTLQRVCHLSGDWSICNGRRQSHDDIVPTVTRPNCKQREPISPDHAAILRSRVLVACEAKIEARRSRIGSGPDKIVTD